MPPIIKYRLLARWLNSQGFWIVRQKGSHQRWQQADGRKCTVPNHKEIAYGTFVSICEQVGCSPQEVLKFF